MPQKTVQRPPETDPVWDWHNNYRLWDANRKVFHSPANWIEPDLRLPPAFRKSLREMVGAISRECATETKERGSRRLAGRKAICVLLTGRNSKSALVGAQTLARALGLDLYRIDLGAVLSKYIGETEKNLRRIFAAAKDARAILFFDEADALFGRRSEVKDSHDRFTNVEADYLFQRLDAHGGLSILTVAKRTNIDAAFLRRLRFVIAIPPLPRKKAAASRANEN